MSGERKASLQWLRDAVAALLRAHPGVASERTARRVHDYLAEQAEGETLHVHASRETVDGLETLVECEGYRSREDAAENVLADGVKDAVEGIGDRHA